MYGYTLTLSWATLISILMESMKMKSKMLSWIGMKTGLDEETHVSQSGGHGEDVIFAWSMCVTLNRTAFS